MESFPPHVILFDGICNLCNGAVQFIIERDQKRKFHYGSLQGKTAAKILEQAPGLSQMDSIVYYEKGKFYTSSTAALRILKKLGGFWSLCYVLILLPRFIRDYVYRKIAANRYRWFGTTRTCWVMKPEWSDRFLS